jgi:hypothetical protein
LKYFKQNISALRHEELDSRAISLAAAKALSSSITDLMKTSPNLSEEAVGWRVSDAPRCFVSEGK